MTAYQSDIAAYESLGPGRPFGSRYALVSLLGRGGFGKVFLARDLALEIPVALKVLNPILASDTGQLVRFKREVIIARKVSHPNVCKIFDFGQIETLTYLSMEYVHGQNLYAILRKYKTLSVRNALGLCREIALALEAAHREGIVHRDLKPHNVMIDLKGHVKIMDFGIARSADMDGLTYSGTVMGSPSYMSPEQCRGEAGDLRSDLYSLGVVLYQMITGVSPFIGNTPLGTLYLHIQQPPRPPIELMPTMPSSVNELILRCMAKDPEQRPASASVLRNEMGAILREHEGVEDVSGAELAALVEIVEDKTPAVPIRIAPLGEPVAGNSTTANLFEPAITTSMEPDAARSQRPAMLPTMAMPMDDAPQLPMPIVPRPSIPPPRFVTKGKELPPLETPSSTPQPLPPEPPRVVPPVEVRRGRGLWMGLGTLLGSSSILLLGWLIVRPLYPDLDETLAPRMAPQTPSLEVLEQGRVLDFLAKAEALENRGEVDGGPEGGAAAVYKRVLSIDPQNPVASTRLAAIVANYRHRAVEELRAGRYQEALDLAQRALIHVPGDVSSHQLFKTALDKMIQESGSMASSLVRARQLIASNEPEAARILLRELLATEPEHPEALLLDRRAQELAAALQSKAEPTALMEPTGTATVQPEATPSSQPTVAPVATASPPPAATPTPAIPTPLPPEAEPSPAAPTEGQLVELGPGVTPPVLMDEVRLKLPTSFVSAYRGKTIEASVLVSERGEVLDAKITSIPQRSYSTQILQQIQRLKFKPAQVGQVRVRCWNPLRIGIQ